LQNSHVGANEPGGLRPIQHRFCLAQHVGTCRLDLLDDLFYAGGFNHAHGECGDLLPGNGMRVVPPRLLGVRVPGFQAFRYGSLRLFRGFLHNTQQQVFPGGKVAVQGGDAHARG